MPNRMGLLARIACRRPLALVALAGCGTALAACGTPAVVTPAQNPLPGLKRDVQAAQGVVAQSQQQALSYGATGVTP